MTVLAAAIVDATLLIREGDSEPTTRIAPLDVEMSDLRVDPEAASVAVGLSGSGHVDVGAVHYDAIEATGNRAELAADAGIFTVTGLELTTAQGLLGLHELVVDMNQDPYAYRASLSGEEIDLNGILEVTDDNALGGARVEIDAAGSGPETDQIVGSGRVELDAGRIPDAPILRSVADAVGLELSGARYEATTIEFDLIDDRADIRPFLFVLKGARLEAAGSIGIDGALDLRTQVSVERERIDLSAWGDFSDSVADALTDEEGWISVPLLVGGTTEAPSVRPDTDAVLAALQASAGQGLSRWLRGIIKR